MSYYRNCRRVFLTLLFVSALWAGREFKAGPNEETVTDELLVRFKPGVVPVSVLSTVIPGAQLKLIDHLNLHVIQLPHGLPPGIAAKLANHPDVEFVEPNRIRHASVQTPNDPDFSQQWALQAVE